MGEELKFELAGGPYAVTAARLALSEIDALVAESQAFDIRAPSVRTKVSTLSGGNQQKVVVGREFDRKLTLLILDQPTRGLDVGSIEFIHRRTIQQRDANAAILLVSAELDEVLELSDRIAVMYRGQVVAVLDSRTADKNEVGLLMATGGRGDRAPATAGQATT